MSSDLEELKVTSESTEPEQEGLMALIQGFNQSFDEQTSERLRAGAEEYGEFAFLGNDVAVMLQEELLDIANYARFMYIKIGLLNAFVSQRAMETGLIPDGGISASEMGKVAWGEEGWS